ncbi:ketosteroid isomerase-related protein [Hyaloraphidium curvatum]|nr:ketosteroid isomerase-related protein [Hyaloraphidium curvatum]
MPSRPAAPHTPAGRLVALFGRPDEMRALYAPDVQWSLSASLPFPRPMKGIDAVWEFNKSVWGVHHFPDCTVEILDECGDERSSAVRFIYRARFRDTGGAYENEYTLFARAGEGGITEVFEALDTLALTERRSGKEVGPSFAALMPPGQ